MSNATNSRCDGLAGPARCVTHLSNVCYRRADANVLILHREPSHRECRWTGDNATSLGPVRLLACRNSCLRLTFPTEIIVAGSCFRSTFSATGAACQRAAPAPRDLLYLEAELLGPRYARHPSPARLHLLAPAMQLQSHTYHLRCPPAQSPQACPVLPSRHLRLAPLGGLRRALRKPSSASSARITCPYQHQSEPARESPAAGLFCYRSVGSRCLCDPSRSRADEGAPRSRRM